MPPKKRSYKRSFRRRKPGAKLATVAKVKRLIRGVQESKYFDASLGLTTITYSSNIGKVTTIPQGDTDITRDGDSLIPTSFEISWVWTGFQSADPALAYDLCRIIVFRWHPDDNVDAPTAAKILAQVNGFAPYSPYEHDQRRKFTVLMDRRERVMQMLSTAGIEQPTTGSQTVFHHKRLRLKKVPIRYNGAGTTGSQNLYVMMVSDEQTDGPTGSYYCRVNFTDS